MFFPVTFPQQDSATQAAADSADLDVKLPATSAPVAMTRMAMAPMRTSPLSVQ